MTATTHLRHGERRSTLVEVTILLTVLAIVGGGR